MEGAIWQPGGLTLLYAEKADGEGSFFIYDSTKNSFQIFVQIMGIENHYIVPVAPQEAVPDGLRKKICSGTTLTCRHIRRQRAIPLCQMHFICFMLITMKEMRHFICMMWQKAASSDILRYRKLLL